MQEKLTLPMTAGHKGQNGKLLIIGGSRLFHAASLWSAQVASHLVDMVFYASTSENNLFAKTAKSNFRDGIVIERDSVLDYAAEADVILLGPGLARGQTSRQDLEAIIKSGSELTHEQWQNDTYLVTNWMLARFPEKKFVLDAGALQMLELDWVSEKCILTPHQAEWQQLQDRAKSETLRKRLQAATILSKNQVDQVLQGGQVITKITGGNAGLTKGGSGDVLAGLTAGLYCYNEAVAACEWASQTLKTAADDLFKTYGPFYTTTQLCEQIPETLWRLVNA